MRCHPIRGALELVSTVLHTSDLAVIMVDQVLISNYSNQASHSRERRVRTTAGLGASISPRTHEIPLAREGGSPLP